MKNKNVTVLPVLNFSKEVVGIVTYKDIFKAFIDLSSYHQAGSRFLIHIQKDNETGGRTEHALTGAEYTITRL